MHHANEPKGGGGVTVTPELLRKQEEAIREAVLSSVRTHLDDRLGKQGPGRGGWLAQYRADVYFLMTVAALVGLYRALPDRPTVDDVLTDGIGADTTSQHGQPRDEATESLMAEAVADPDAGLRRYVRSNPTRTSLWLQDAAVAEGVAGDAITSAHAEQLRGIAEKNKSNLTDDDISGLRDLFFAYAYGRWERQERGENAAGFRVDPAYAGFDAALLRSLVERLDLGDVVKQEVPATDPGLRTAVVVRWIQSYAPADSF